MADTFHPIPRLAPEILLALAARRLYSAAVAAGRTRETVPALGALEPLTKQAMELTAEQTQQSGATFSTLSYLFDLDRYAADLLLLGIALELDERIFNAASSLTGTLIGSPGPRIGSLLSLLYQLPSERISAMGALQGEAPLVRYRLVRIIGEGKVPVSQREFCGEPSLLPHLFHGPPPGLPAPLIGLADLVPPSPTPLSAEDALAPDLARAIGLLQLEEVGFKRLHVHPLQRRDALPLALRIATDQGRPVIALDLRTIEKEMDEPVALTLRECRLRHGVPLFLNPLSATQDDEPSPKVLDRVAQRWRRVLASEPGLVIFASDSKEAPELSRLERIGVDLADYAIEKSTLSGRTESFQRALQSVGRLHSGGVTDVTVSDEVTPEQLAAIFRVDDGEINAIVRHAALQAQLRAIREGQAPVVGPDDLWQAGREQTRRDIGKYATLVQSRYKWADLVLADETHAELMDLYKAACSRMRVFEHWGYAKKHVRGLGLCAMFFGDSGTGKTMAAEVIANMLKVNMYRVDLSMVVSKWLGETERNLSEIFAATEASDCILFFDEADSLFGKRTEVNDARDRYANVETSYLLQRIESFDGIVILSTNLRSNIDTAFLRRLQFGIPFEKPDEALRLKLWRKSFPPEVPLGKDVDLAFLARHYDDLTGGQIRMVALGACMLAAYDRATVDLGHIHRAFSSEMSKMQRLVYREIDEVVSAQIRSSRTAPRPAPPRRGPPVSPR